MSEDGEHVLRDLADQLVRSRVQLGLDIDAAARAAGIAPERLMQAEEGQAALGAEELEALAGVYGLDVTAFFGGRTTPLSYLAGF